MAVFEPDAPRSRRLPVDVDEVRKRALLGAVLLAGKGVAMQLVSLLGLIVVARVLTPRELGVAAIGLTLTTFIGYMSGGIGIAGALIRRPEPPTRFELESLLGLQLVLTVIIVAGTALAGSPFGDVGVVAAIMACALPVTAFRLSGMVLLERNLVYGRIVGVEALEVVAYQGWIVATVLAGWGVWGLASAVVFRAAVGTAAMIAVSPLRVLRPRLAWRSSRSLVGIGARIQATQVADALRDQIVNVVAAALGGLHVLGVWTVASRVLQLPLMLFNTLLRVAFPALSRILGDARDATFVVDRTLRASATAAGLVLAPLAAGSPAFVPAIFGAEWMDAAPLLVLGCAAAMVAAPASIAVIAYLWAIGDAHTPLRASVALAIAWPMLAAVLLPLVGPPALGAGFVGGSLVFVLTLRRGPGRDLRLGFVRPVLVPTVAWLGGSAVGLAVARALDPTIATAVVAAATSLLVYVAALAALWRAQLAEWLPLVAGSARRRASAAAATGAAAGRA
jgi:O-antigen/teichoic acid export membrane protein